MSRIIDADELREFVIGVSREARKNKSSPGTAIIYDMCVQFVNMIDSAPTIPAIPLDWLREKMRGYASALKSTEMDAVVRVLKMWEEEQEGRDG